ncbi:hypothetical protein NPIL_263121 [Nephila pilipes]|uniref:Uncharacterized protein n=1 Tax=Nephila pilipes TaxID=299642 RepID=A0A8X6PTC0_NEPPI|nr:hypothetical protein NPIL_263121 [Nephila pilipes]
MTTRLTQPQRVCEKCQVAHCKECVGNPISGSTRDAEDEWDVAERDFINGDGKRDPVAEEDGGEKKGLICIFRESEPFKESYENENRIDQSVSLANALHRQETFPSLLNIGRDILSPDKGQKEEKKKCQKRDPGSVRRLGRPSPLFLIDPHRDSSPASKQTRVRVRGTSCVVITMTTVAGEQPDALLSFFRWRATVSKTTWLY